MIDPKNRNRCVRATSCVAASALLLLLVGSGCASGRGRAFESPQEGVSALVGALQPLDAKELLTILGPKGDQIVSSGDEVADRNAAAQFVASYNRKHNIVVEDGKATLLVGEDDWPLPIPLVRDGKSWRFDTDAGDEEILARRIGRNELATIETCRAIVDAQREYSNSMGGKGDQPVYAQKFASDPGQRNGLYWETKSGEPESPLGPEIVAAVAQGYGGKRAPDAGPRPYHGYCYRILTAQGPSAAGGARSYLVNGQMTGGFAVVAWPIEYHNSGIMTFMVSDQGVVYQKNLGKDTERLAAKISTFDPDASWEIVP